MKIWTERSGKEWGTAYVAAEHDGVSGFAALHVGAREILRGAVHAASLLGATAMLRGLTKRKKSAKAATRNVRQAEKYAAKQYKNMARSLSKSLKR